jgi:phenylacetic acid degradation operon negative regulatory protein
MIVSTTGHYLQAYLRHARPRLNTLLKLALSEAQVFGQGAQWLSSLIELMQPLGFQERTVRTAVFRLTEHQELLVERHGRCSLCRLAPQVTAAIETERQRLNRPPARAFDQDWTMLVNSGGISAARHAAARQRLRALDFCELAPNVLARPAACGAGNSSHLPAAELHGLALFEVSGTQLAAAVHQPLFGRTDWDLATPAALYRQFQQRFTPLRQLLCQKGAISDEQACRIRLLVSHGYQQCRGSDPMLPQELLPDDWPAMAAYQTYVALYSGCAAQARRHLMRILATAAAKRPSRSEALVLLADGAIRHKQRKMALRVRS